jgi:hypothetical protein
MPGLVGSVFVQEGPNACGPLHRLEIIHWPLHPMLSFAIFYEAGILAART